MAEITTGEMPIVVLISGSGSNLQAIIDLAKTTSSIRICAVISNRADAFGLQRAIEAGIPTAVLDHNRYADRESYDRALRDCIDSYAPGLVVLAGFMRILGDAFVNHYLGKMLNIHPSLLPKYRGLNTHQRALAAGDDEHGASVHFVTPELDGGPVVLQAKVQTKADDTPERLAQRVLAKEHQIFPLAIRWFAEGRLKMQNGQAVLDGKPLLNPISHKDESSGL